MNLQSELDALAKRVARFHKSPHVGEEEWSEFANNTVVAIATGGESSRFAQVLAGKQLQKGIMELPNGDTMTEMTIRMYRDAGIKKFVALVFNHAHAVEDRLGDGSDLGVEIVYSHDPEHPVGRGGAIRNALENGSIPMSSNVIATNPADFFINFPGSFPRYIAEAHIEGAKKGKLATPVLALGQASPWTGMVVDDNEVVDTLMYPFIPIPSHVGTTIFSPEVLPRFKALFSLTEKSDYEPILFPELAREHKLWAAGLLEGTWLQVKDARGYKELLEAIESKKL